MSKILTQDEDDTVVMVDDGVQIQTKQIKVRPPYIRKLSYELGYERHVIDGLYEDIQELCKSKGIVWDLSSNAPWGQLESMVMSCMHPEGKKPEELRTELVEFKDFLKKKGLNFMDLVHSKDIELYFKSFMKWKPLLDERKKTFMRFEDEEGNYVHFGHEEETPLSASMN